MKPALFTFPEEIDTIAVFKRDHYQSDTVAFDYRENNEVLTDDQIHYCDLSNKCVDALAAYLENEDYFSKVVNFSDSLNYLFINADSLINYPGLHKKLGIDACIFLDFFQLDDHLTNNPGYYAPRDINVKFPEFQNSTKVERIKAKVLWTVTYKGDTSVYLCKLPDDLYYGNSVDPGLFGNNVKHRLLLMNGEYVKAAEIYNRETKNKNRNIAAKAKYNMALVCEMEGEIDAAIDWLVSAYSAHKQNNEEHKFNCKQYGELLAMRKKEIEKLAKQVRNDANTTEK